MKVHLKVHKASVVSKDKFTLDDWVSAAYNLFTRRPCQWRHLARDVKLIFQLVDERLVFALTKGLVASVRECVCPRELEMFFDEFSSADLS